MHLVRPLNGKPMVSGVMGDMSDHIRKIMYLSNAIGLTSRNDSSEMGLRKEEET